MMRGYDALAWQLDAGFRLGWPQTAFLRFSFDRYHYKPAEAFNVSRIVKMAEHRQPQEETEEDFGALLSASEQRDFSLEPGDTVNGHIVSIGPEFVFVDLGGKSEGMIDRVDLQNDDGEIPFKVGDSIEAIVQSTQTADGVVRLSRRLSQQARGNEQIQSAFSSKLPVSGRVTSQNKGGYEVIVAGMRAFCPLSQIELGFTQNPEQHVGKTYDFLITEYAEGGRKFVLSRAALQKNHLAEAKSAAKGKLREGQILIGTVSSIRDFGVFVDIEGLAGLVHISEMSWSRTESANDVVKVGDKIPVKILSIDWSRDRIALSVKQAQSDPWEHIEQRFSVGQTYRGIVARVEDFGAFVELSPGIDGLIHISELTWDRRVRRASDVVQKGQEVEVQLLGIDVVKKRISLGMKQLASDPWDGIVDRYAPGTNVEGTVAKVADFGVFVDIEAGITGLLPKSESATEKGANIRRFFQPGARIEVQVLELDPASRKLTLTRKPLVESDPSSDDADAEENREIGRAHV